MIRRKTILLLAALGALLALVAVIAKRAPRNRADSTASDLAVTISPHEPLPARSELGAAARLDEALAALRTTATPEDAGRILTDLHACLASLPPDLASSVITRFLADPSKDAGTGIEFKVGERGSLAGHPSLRIALLDWLGGIDPGRAGEVAEGILSTPTDPDEWAVCLRNHARARPGAENHGFLHAKTEELIRNPVWREEPSVGFLEAFDVLVHTRATESTGLLGQLVADTSPEARPLAHAAYLTLDRLTIREPAAMMRQLSAHPDLARTRGPMVANMFARADLREPDQRALVREYLLDPVRTRQELHAFAGVYPNANYSISRNLLTKPTTARGPDLAAHDRAALIQVNKWLENPEFEPVKPCLETMHRRLTRFVGQQLSMTAPPPSQKESVSPKSR